MRCNFAPRFTPDLLPVFQVFPLFFPLQTGKALPESPCGRRQG